MRSSRPRISILVGSSTDWGRRIIRGIANYALKHGPWELVVKESGLDEPQHLRSGWQGDGIIARINTTQLGRELGESGLPVVNVSGILLKGVDTPRVTTDYHAVARVAVEHFVHRGYRNLAYCGLQYRSYEERHCQAYVDALSTRELPCSVFRSRLKGRRRNWPAEQNELQDWLKALPKPIGILTWGNRRGRDLLNLCMECGIAVPEQVAVLAGDDDELLCSVCHPSLSAIINPSEQTGYEAARMLDGLLQGKKPPGTPLMLEPTGIHTRVSTDTLSIDDPALCRALRYIRDHAQQPIQVADAAEAAQVSRRSLERRFHEHLGRSPAREIQEVRLKKAKTLLRDTDMPIADVAAACGFGSTEYMIKVFQKTTGRTPRKYRTWVKAR